MTETPFRTPYPSYDVLAKWDTPSWNPQTRRVVAHRVDDPPPRRFFDEDAYALLRAVIDCILPQPERTEATRIPVEAFIDEMLHQDQSDGTRYVDVPPQREAWTRGLAAIDAEARARHGRGFADLAPDDQTSLFAAIDRGETDNDLWTGVEPKRFFRSVLLKQAVKVYYAHPFAWSEMGFGGPAAPRGYVRLGFDQRDSWEAREERVPQRLRPPE